MASHTASIGYDSFCLLHNWNPVRCSHSSNEDFPFLEAINICWVQDNMGLTSSFTRGCRQAFDNDFTICCSSCCFNHFRFILTGPNCFRAGLQNPKFTIPFVYAPFHIHIATVMFFDCFRVGSQFQYLRIRNNLLFSFCFWYHFFHSVTVSLTNQANIFIVDHTIRDFHFSLINAEVIRCYNTTNYIFTKAISTFDEDVVIVTSYEVNGEHNASRFGVHHHLNSSRQGNSHVVKTLFYAVVSSAISEGGRIAFLYLLDDNISASNIEVGILLTSKGSIWQIFCCSGGTNCYERIFFPYFFAQFFVGSANSSSQGFWHFCVTNHLTDISTYFTKQGRIIYVIKVIKSLFNLSF